MKAMKMRVLPFLAVLGLAVVHSSALAQSGAKVDPGLEAATKKFAQAFDSADPKTFASFYAPDATVINPLGRTAHGPAEIEKMFSNDGKSVFTGSKSTMTITGTRELTPDLVWLDIDHTAQNVHLADGGTTLRAHMVVLAQKKGADWKWVEVRAWRPMPPGGAAHGGAPAK